MTRSARKRDASTQVGSFKVVRACRGRACPTGFDPAGLAVGRVEHVDRPDGSSPEGVEAAAVQVVPLGGGGIRNCGFSPWRASQTFFGLIGKNRRSPQAIDQQTGVGEGPVAKDHGGQAKTAGPADKTVFRIVFALPVVHFTGLPIGRARDDQPVHFLLAPTQILEFHGQPVQEIEVKGVLALHAEIFGGLDQADSEKPLPHPVDLDAGGQGCSRESSHLDNPRRLRGQSSFIGGRKEGVERDGFAFFQVFAPQQKMSLPFLGVIHDHRFGYLGGLVVFEFLFQSGLLLDQRGEGGVLLEKGLGDCFFVGGTAFVPRLAKCLGQAGVLTFERGLGLVGGPKPEMSEVVVLVFGIELEGDFQFGSLGWLDGFFKRKEAAWSRSMGLPDQTAQPVPRLSSKALAILRGPCS